MLLDRWRLSAGLPVVVQQRGDNGAVGTVRYTAPSTASVGDVRLGADVLLAGAPGGPLRVGLGAFAFVPTGNRRQYTSDEELRFAPRLMLAGDLGPVGWAARGGVHMRPDGGVAFPGLGNEAEAAAAVGLRLGPWQVGPELYAASAFDGFLTEKSTPAEALLGAQFLGRDWRVGVAAGPGLTGALGTPGFRAVVRIDFAPAPRAAPPPEPEAPAAWPAPPPRDRDGDGIPDGEDACPEEAGPATANPASNGCPAALDRDGDHIPDADDACPDIAGGKSTDPRTNGCPDRDGDGVYDPEDACPEQAGPRNPDRSRNGCPVARVEKGQIRILEQVRFKTGSAVILPESDPVLQAVAKILAEHAEIKKVRVEGHTDNRGGVDYNRALSQKRAAAVVRWLVEHAIARGRLTSQGFGPARPIATNKTEEGRQENRRVELHILDPPQSEEAP
jgi:OmpA-OmpF porin, OOP family